MTVLAQNEGLNRQNDSKRPRTRNIHQNVPRDAPETPQTTPLQLSAAQTAPGASQRFWAILITKS